jgi:hypothetical protein
MDFKCYLFPGWEPRIRPAVHQRDWMDEAPESFAYRCLPLGIANASGWEILSPCGFEAEWNGGIAAEDVVVRGDLGTPAHHLPQPLFGLGTFTIHIQGLFRTPPGWNLAVGGPPNRVKDGIAPLSGVIEADWSPYTFTMNWRFTRPDHAVRFEENEPIAFITPMPRGSVEAMEPCFVPIADDPELQAEFRAWSASRNAFQDHVRDHPPAKPADKWQKFYYRGLMPDGKCPFPDHQSKLQVKAFANPGLAGGASEAMARPIAPPLRTRGPLEQALRKRDWLLATQQHQRALSKLGSGIFRRENLSAEEFLDRYYAPGQPVVLAGEIEHWPALAKWNPDYLSARIGPQEVTYQDERDSHPDFERHKDNHTRRGRFDDFMQRITREAGNCAYLTAYNAGPNATVLAPLDADIGQLDKFLATPADGHGGLIWIGPAGTFTPLHHDLTNNLLVQVVGRKRVVLAAASETPNLYNDSHVFSRIPDVTDPAIDLSAFPRLADVTFHEVVLQPGEILYIPIGWWHQVEALDFSVSLTFTNFRWRNDWSQGFPK